MQMQMFHDIIIGLPLEIKINIGNQLYYYMDIENMIRTGIPEDYMQNPVIPYMEIDYPYVRFKPVKMKGGISLVPSSFNDFDALNDRLFPLKDILNSLFHGKTKLRKLVIYCRGNHFSEYFDLYSERADQLIVYNPSPVLNQCIWWSSVREVKFNKRYILHSGLYHGNLRVIDYIRVRFSGVESMLNFFNSAIESTSTYAQSTNLQSPITLKFRIINGKPLESFKEKFINLNALVNFCMGYNVNCLFKVRKMSPDVELLKSTLGENKIILCD